jgi:hypothetical protein
LKDLVDELNEEDIECSIQDYNVIHFVNPITDDINDIINDAYDIIKKE